MWSSRLFWKLFLLCVGLNFLFAMVVLLGISRQQEELVRDQVERRLRDTATALRSGIMGQLTVEGRDVLQERVAEIAKVTQTRLTVIDLEGIVVADSDEDPRVMDNHRYRPEIRQAVLEGTGVWERHSETSKTSMYYVAVSVRDHGKIVGFVRAAMSTGSIAEVTSAARRLLWLFTGAMGLISALLVYAFVARAMQPLAQLKEAAASVGTDRPTDPFRVPLRGELESAATAIDRLKTELAERKDEFQEYGSRLCAVLGAMVEGVIVVDAASHVVLANGASRSLLGVTSTQVLGRPLREVTPYAALHDAVDSAMISDDPQEFQLETSGGHPHLLAIRAVGLSGAPGRGAVVVLHDVTELRALENVRHEFVANVSHELKTPLASIKAYAETLRLGAINDPQHNAEFVTRIEEQAEQLHRLILDVLSLARVEAGRDVLEITELKVESIVMPSVAHFRESSAEKGIELDAAPPDNPVLVRADDEACRAIMDNLLDNAIKYTPKGGSITVRWRKEGAHVLLEVVDTGIGIAPGDQSRVFERFFRVDKARSRELGGTGLGLSIVKHLAHALGGSVRLTSRLGEGSCFQVRIPTA